MNKVEIFLLNPAQYRLDVGDFDMSFNYSFNDVRDVSTRNGSYSKTLVLPGTKNNNFVFAGLFDVNADYTLFNPNVKVDSKVVVNSKVVMEGFFTLNSIEKLNNVDSQGNTIYYNVTIFSKSIDLIDALGDKTISDLQSLSKFDHEFTISNIIDSWNNNYTSGYAYPLYPSLDPEVGDNPTHYKFEHFHPAVYYYQVLDAMLIESGYGWTGDFKNNAQFKKEIIPYLGDAVQILDDGELKLREVEIIDQTAGVSSKITSNVNVAIGSNTLGNGVVLYDTDIIDLSNQYDNIGSTSQRVFTSGFYQKTKFQIRIGHRFRFINDSLTSISVDPNNKFKADINFICEVKYTNGNTIQIGSKTVTNITGPTSLVSGDSYVTGVLFTEFETNIVELEPGDEVRVIVTATHSAGDIYKTSLGGIGVVSLYLQQSNTTTDYGHFINKVEGTTLSPGLTVRIKNFFPNIKLSDLIVDLIKRYNLIIYTDPDNPRNLKFDTYNDYYQKDIRVLDWTDKKDYSREDKIEFLPDLRPDTVLFSYTPDNDQANKDYTDTTKETYGQFELKYEDLSQTGKLDVITPFSPTPVIRTDFGAYVPYISRENPRGKPRVLYFGGTRNLENGGTITIDSVIAPLTNYPYAGHLDDPVSPDLDINFDACRYYFYDIASITANNLYNLYWSAYMGQVENGKMLTAYFYLNEKDIELIKDDMSFRVWVKDAYYFINRVFDYNPLKNGVTKVELLKVRELGEYISETITTNANTVVYCPTDLTVKQVVQPDGSTLEFYDSASGAAITEDCCISLNGNWDSNLQICYLRPNGVIPPNTIGTIGISTGSGVVISPRISSGVNNIAVGTYSEIVLDENEEERQITYVNKQFLFGNDNKTGFDSSFIIGSDNTVNQSNVSIINSSNNIVNAAKTTIIGVDDKTVDIGSSTYLGEYLRIDNPSGDIYHNELEIERTYYKTIRILSEEFLTLGDVPIRLIENTNPNEYIMIENIHCIYEAGTDYTNDADIEVYVENTPEIYFIGEGLVSAPSDGIYKLIQYVFKHYNKAPASQNKLGGSVYIRTSENPTGGDFDIILTIHYRVINIENI